MTAEKAQTLSLISCGHQPRLPQACPSSTIGMLRTAADTAGFTAMQQRRTRSAALSVLVQTRHAFGARRDARLAAEAGLLTGRRRTRSGSVREQVDKTKPLYNDQRVVGEAPGLIAEASAEIIGVAVPERLVR